MLNSGIGSSNIDGSSGLRIDAFTELDEGITLANGSTKVRPAGMVTYSLGALRLGLKLPSRDEAGDPAREGPYASLSFCKGAKTLRFFFGRPRLRCDAFPDAGTEPLGGRMALAEFEVGGSEMMAGIVVDSLALPSMSFSKPCSAAFDCSSRYEDLLMSGPTRSPTNGDVSS